MKPSLKLEKITQSILDDSNLVYLVGELPLQAIQEDEDRGGLYRAIIFESKVVGLASISSELECSVAVHPNFQKRGIATEALTQLARLAFEEFGYKKVTARTQLGRPSSKLISKFGLKEVSRTKDEICYEITNQMWSVAKN